MRYRFLRRTKNLQPRFNAFAILFFIILSVPAST